MSKFQRSFNEELLKEIPLISVGVFPGKFKPPHKGHFKTAQIAGKQNKVVYIFISDKTHEDYSPDISLTIWEIYKKYLPNAEPYIVTRTPMVATYELLNILNNGGEFIPTKTASSPLSNIEDVIQTSSLLQTYLNKGNNFKINLYSSPEDAERYRNVKKEPYSGRNLTDVSFKPVDRVTSATKFRKAILSKNFKEIENFLPSELSKEDKNTILNILLK